MRPLLSRLIVILISGLVLAAEVYAQCPMCRGAVAASQDSAQSTGYINFAVLVLLVPPVAIFVGIFGIGYKYRNSPNRDDSEKSPPVE